MSAVRPAGSAVRAPAASSAATLKAAAIWLAAAALSLGAVSSTRKFWRLVADPGLQGAYDLKHFYSATRSWFEGVPIYEIPQLAPTYPPARWALLWPTSAGLYTVALLKPTITGPFFLLILIVPRRLRPAVLAIVSYSALTFVATLFQSSGIPELFRGWITASERGLGEYGYGEVRSWLQVLGWKSVAWAAAGGILAIHAAVTWRYKRADQWILIGVAAIVGRLWTDHQVYDDAMLFLAFMAMARVTASPRTPASLARIAGTTLAIAGIVFWMPLQLHYSGSTIGPFVVSRAWVTFFNTSHTFAMLLMLGVLLTAAAAEVRSQRTATRDMAIA